MCMLTPGERMEMSGVSGIPGQSLMFNLLTFLFLVSAKLLHLSSGNLVDVLATTLTILPAARSYQPGLRSYLPGLRSYPPGLRSYLPGLRSYLPGLLSYQPGLRSYYGDRRVERHRIYIIHSASLMSTIDS